MRYFARSHACELSLFEVGDDVGLLERHDLHQLRAGVYELTYPDRPSSHRSIDRCTDDGVTQIEFRLLARREGALVLSLRQITLGSQHIDLISRLGQGCLRARHACDLRA